MDKFIEKIEKNKIAIIRTWISSPRVIKIIRTYSINEDLLVKRYSFGFLEHYLLVIKNDEKTQNCPVVMDFLKYLTENKKRKLLLYLFYLE